jgi:hypothetical protein
VEVYGSPLVSRVTGARLAHHRDRFVLYEDNVKSGRSGRGSSVGHAWVSELPEIGIAAVR